MRNTNAQLRALGLQRRRALTPLEVAAKSRAIIATVGDQTEVRDANPILCYVASKDGEVDTKPFIAARIEQEKTVLVPCVDANRTITWSRLDSLAHLAPGPYGILEPLPEFRADHIPPPDAPVIVPGIAFSPCGHRIGYGKGYYDRFLTAHAGLKIGLAYDLQITDAIQPMEHDVAMDMVVTESCVYDCRP